MNIVSKNTRSSFNNCIRNNRSNLAGKFSSFRSKNADTFTRSSFSSPAETSGISTNFYAENRQQIKMLQEGVRNSVQHELSSVEKDDYESVAKNNFKWIEYFEKDINECIPKRLEEAGVPSDLSFEFDYDLDSGKCEITKISDDMYRENVESVLNGITGFPFIACASRVMNGYTSSLYYSSIGRALDRCFEQDIAELYIDENGELCGTNENLQKALVDGNQSEISNGDYYVESEKKFPADNIEGIIRRLISDENITANISHMGYDSKQIYTNDGEFKLGKDFDPGLFSNKHYLMRGIMALYFTAYNYDWWLSNEKML